MRISKVKIYDMNESITASKYPKAVDVDKCNCDITDTVVKLAQAHKGSGHDNFLKGILVSFDLTFSNKAWVEAERYNFLVLVSSQSTMHCITRLDIRKQCNIYVWDSTIEKLEKKVKIYNSLEDKNSNKAKELYLEILYNVPAGFELTARLSTNYAQLKTIYSQRKNHRLPEWRYLCDWIKSLPNNNLIIKEM